MENKRKKFVQGLIDEAWNNIWKNELFLKYNKDLPEDKAKAAEEYIKRDKEYIKFLESEM